MNLCRTARPRHAKVRIMRLSRILAASCASLAVAAAVLLTQAFSWEAEPPSTYYPVFMTRAELDGSVKYVADSRPIVTPGKIWAAGNLIFVVDNFRGVHVFDNTDPRNPRAVGYIVAPGCVDIAVRGDIVYLDNAVDLVALDLSTGTVADRIRNFFPERTESPDGRVFCGERPAGMILVGWRLEE